jgi:ketosteroid isomerase-like protein
VSAEDRLAILETIARYSQAFDGKDARAYAALFTDDGVFEIVMRGAGEPLQRYAGSAAIFEWVGEAFRGRLAEVQTRHNQSATVFDELSSSTARTRTMLIETRQRSGERHPSPYTTGVYQDEWRRTEQGWRIARRAVHIDRV